MELEDVYDGATLARIDEAGRGRRGTLSTVAPASPSGTASATQRATAAIAIATATAVGLRGVFEVPERVRQEELDPWVGGGTHPRVRFHWHPVPWLSVAEVLG
jgi:hypothetical protein